MMKQIYYFSGRDNSSLQGYQALIRTRNNKLSWQGLNASDFSIHWTSPCISNGLFNVSGFSMDFPVHHLTVHRSLSLFT